MHECGSESNLVSDNKMNWLTDSDGDGESSLNKDSSSRGGAVAPVLKKGPWTPSEDAILEAYIKKHGERNWKSVQKNTGLLRCGKSCRLRWMNHLRPDLKKGAFSKEEEDKIIRLHYKMGNKWARMSAQLPGRTDNEIKNYWNTRIKKCKNIHSLLYPTDVCQQTLDENQHEFADFGFREKPTNDSLYAPSFTCDSYTGHLEDTSIYYAPQFLDASIKNILGHRFVSKDYDCIQNQRNRIEVAAKYDIPLPPLNLTNNITFPSANFLVSHGFSNDQSTTGPMKLALPSIQFTEFDPNNRSMYTRTSAAQLTNFADVYMHSTSLPTNSNHVAPRSSDQPEVLHEAHPLNYVVKEELYAGSLNSIVGVPCDVVTESSEQDPCEEYQEQDHDFYTLVENGFCAPSLFPVSLEELHNSELSSAQTFMAGSNELLLPHYQDGDVSPLRGGFMPNTHYFNAISPYIFEGTTDLCMENMVDTKGN